MKCTLFFIFIFPVFFGCGSSDTGTQPLEIANLDSIKIIRNTNPTLVGGGRLFFELDTAIWYDALFSFTVKNPTQIYHNLRYSIGVGTLKNGTFIGEMTGFLRDTSITICTEYKDTLLSPL
jgi:hypothetical protein